MHLIRLALLTLCAAHAAPAYGGTAFSADDLVRLQRIADPQASADGRYVVFVLRATDMAANRGHTHLWLIDRTEANPPARVLALNAANDSSPRWAPVIPPEPAEPAAPHAAGSGRGYRAATG